MHSRGLARLMAPLLVAACGAPSATRPASWPALAGAQRARFATTASPEVVRANACALTGTFKAGERDRTWKVTVGERECWSRPDANSIPLYVYMEPNLRAVVLEAAASDVPEETLRTAVASTGLSLKDAVDRTQEVRTSLAQNKNNGGGGDGAVIAAAATGAGVTVAVVVVVVVVLVGAVIAGFAALFTALSKL